MKGVLELGSKGDEVKQLQTLLNERLKIAPALAIDGLFGKGTERRRAAVTTYCSEGTSPTR